MIERKIKIGIFGGHEYSVIVLDKLRKAGFDIAFVLTSPDKPQGRKLVMTAPPAKIWAVDHNIPVLQPEKIKDLELEKTLRDFNCDIFVVMAYGKIIPESILNIPKGKSLNIHPSLLPKFRGPSPVESAILADEKETGVTIMLVDKEMDHGPIVAQEKVVVEPWPPVAEELGKKLVEVGSGLLISILPDWLDGKIAKKDQDHTQATFTKKIEKEDALIDLADDPYKNFLKIQAYHHSPTAYFLVDKKRVKITSASFSNGNLVIEKVIPEGRREMSYKDFNNSN